MPDFEAAYRKALKQGTLQAKIEAAEAAMRNCRLCPRECGVDRCAGETGFCRTADQAIVASFNAHFGEENPLSGSNGSGTIFFSHCNLLCTFCQNYDISHHGEGRAITNRQLADYHAPPAASGCHNINFVTPSHVVPQLLSAVSLAAIDGLSVPLVFNTGGYDKTATLGLLDGVIDIFMPDFKFWDSRIAAQTCDAPDYPEIARRALREMHRQVGDLIIDETGLARKGLLVRHLVLPEGLAGTYEVMRFLAQEVSADTYVNIMPQYRPCGRAAEMAQLARSITRAEYAHALRQAADAESPALTTAAMYS